jgi:hypothetical protein
MPRAPCRLRVAARGEFSWGAGGWVQLRCAPPSGGPFLVPRLPRPPPTPPPHPHPQQTPPAADAKLTTIASGLDAAQQPPAADDDADASACPFLAALPAPPPSGSAWYKRLGQLFSPAQYSAEALGPHDLVAQPPSLGMPGQFVVGRADWVRAVFSGEADGTITTSAPGLLSSREWQVAAVCWRRQLGCLRMPLCTTLGTCTCTCPAPPPLTPNPTPHHHPNPPGQLLGTKNLVVSPEPRHTYLRKLIMPAFTNEAIEKLVPRMEDVLSKYLNKWAGETPWCFLGGGGELVVSTLLAGRNLGQLAQLGRQCRQSSPPSR